MRLELTEELKQKFSEFFPYRNNALSLSCAFENYESQLEKDFASFLDEKNINYVSYLKIKWDFKNSYITYSRKKSSKQIFEYIPDFYIPSKDLVIDIYQKEITTKNKYALASFLFGNLYFRYNKNHLYLSKKVFELIKLDKLDQLADNRKAEITWKLLSKKNIFELEKYLRKSSYNSSKIFVQKIKENKIKRIRSLEPDFINLVYIIKCNDKYKIGSTSSLKKRLQGLNAIIPEKLELIIKIEHINHQLFEKFLHQKFKNQRIKGEWFNLTDENLNYIKSQQCLEDFKKK